MQLALSAFLGVCLRQLGMELLGSRSVPAYLEGGARSVVYSSGLVYVGGAFVNGGGNPDADRVAVWNGLSWLALGTGLNGEVLRLRINNGVLYAGGSFTDAGGNTSADYIATWNGSIWSTLGSGLNSTVNDIRISDSLVYVGGSFTDAGGNPNADRLAVWNGTSWDDLGSTFNNSVSRLALSGPFLYVGGSFTGPSQYFSIFGPVAAKNLNTQGGMSAVADDSGNIHAVFRDTSSSIIYRQYRLGQWEPSVVLDSTPSGKPSLSLDSASTTLYSAYPQGTSIFFTKSLSSSATWSTPVPLFSSGVFWSPTTTERNAGVYPINVLALAGAETPIAVVVAPFNSPTPSLSPTVTNTATTIPTATNTPTNTPSWSPTPSNTVTSTPTRTSAPTSTSVVTPTALFTPTPTTTPALTPTFTPTSTPVPPPDSGQNVVFASSQTYGANLGGIEGADQSCQSLAEAAGLTGQFRAMLSDSTTDASSRFAITDPVYNTRGSLIASNGSALWSGVLASAIAYDENSNPVTGRVWTGSDRTGKKRPRLEGSEYCGNWTDQNNINVTSVGLVTAVDSTWIESASYGSCSLLRRLYCMRAPLVVPTATPTSTSSMTPTGVNSPTPTGTPRRSQTPTPTVTFTSSPTITATPLPDLPVDLRLPRPRFSARTFVALGGRAFGKCKIPKAAIAKLPAPILYVFTVRYTGTPARIEDTFATTKKQGTVRFNRRLELNNSRYAAFRAFCHIRLSDRRSRYSNEQWVKSVRARPRSG